MGIQAREDSFDFVAQQASSRFQMKNRQNVDDVTAKLEADQPSGITGAVDANSLTL